MSCKQSAEAPRAFEIPMILKCCQKRQYTPTRWAWSGHESSASCKFIVSTILVCGLAYWAPTVFGDEHWINRTRTSGCCRRPIFAPTRSLSATPPGYSGSSIPSAGATCPGLYDICWDSRDIHLCVLIDLTEYPRNAAWSCSPGPRS